MATQSKTTKMAPPVSQSQVPQASEKPGFFLTAANWMLSRFPGVRNHYQAWSKTKRIVIGLLLYLVALPIIPLAIAIIWYVRDPEGFKKSKVMPVLLGVIVAWFGAFGLLAVQTPTADVQTPVGQQVAADDSDSKTGSSASTAKKSVADKTVSEPTRGRSFENCDAAFRAGVFNISKSDPSYQLKLDGDKDSVACEK